MTLEQIRQQIDERFAAVPGLSRLNSPSQTAIFRLLRDVVAGTSLIVLQQFDYLRRYFADLLSRGPVGTPQWYAARMLEFRPGAALIEDGDRPRYAADVIQPTLITRATARQTPNRSLLLMVGKGEYPYEQLSGLELIAARGYIDRFQFAGVQIDLVTASADRIRLFLRVTHDAAFALTIKDDVESAIRGYLKDGLGPRSIFERIRLIDAIQLAPGVIDVEDLSIVARQSGQLVTVNRRYEAQSGDIVEEDEEGFTLEDTITYIAQ